MTRRNKETIGVKELGEPLAGYSHVVKSKPGSILFLSGAVGIDPKGNTVGKGDAELQARQAMKNLEFMLRAGGGTIQDVVKTTIYLTRIEDREKVNRAKGEYFKIDPPASTLVVVKELAREDFLLEIDAIAVVP